MKNLILVDFPPVGGWSFLDTIKAITHLDWEIVSKKGTMVVPKWKRIVNYLFFPLCVLFKYKAENIIAWQQFYGLFYAFYSRILPFHILKLKYPNLYILGFIYKEKMGIIGRVYYMVINFIVSSSMIKDIIVYSQNEVDYYLSVFPGGKGKFKFMSLAIDKLSDVKQNEKLKNEKFIFATGRSNRDYRFLVDALDGTNYKLKIACKGLNIKTDANIEVMQNVFGSKMHEYLANCHIVAIPLSDLNISSGQLVILQALQLGKPVIVTNNKTVYNYVDNSHTGWIVENNKKQWLEKIDKLYTDTKEYQTMSKACKEDFDKRFSYESFGKNVAQIIMHDIKK